MRHSRGGEESEDDRLVSELSRCRARSDLVFVSRVVSCRRLVICFGLEGSFKGCGGVDVLFGSSSAQLTHPSVSSVLGL